MGSLGVRAEYSFIVTAALPPRTEMDTPSPAAAHMRKVRSFVRRPGRATAAQRRALAELLPRYGLNVQLGPLDLRAIFGRDAPRVLDIGFGDGEALVTNALNNPEIGR